MTTDYRFIIWMQETFGAESRPFWDAITNLGSTPIIVVAIGLALWLKVR